MPHRRLIRGGDELVYWESPDRLTRNYSVAGRTFLAVRDATTQPWLLCEMAVRKPNRPKEAVAVMPEKVATVALPAAIEELMGV